MKLFGTDGLRGQAGVFPLDAASLRLLGREVGLRMARSGRAKVVIGGDTRESTPTLLAQVAVGLQEAGCRIESAGVIPTPGVAELVLELQADGGISVSASHNPYEDNGIKMFGPDGKKWPDEEEELLEQKLLSSRNSEHAALPPTSPPRTDPALAETYLKRLSSRVPRQLAGLSVLIDAGNGAASSLAPEIFRRHGAQVSSVADRPDGRNINRDCGALYPDAMALRTRQIGAAMGVAFDGDADRAIFSDENGRILDGDDVLWMVALDWKRKGRLPKGGVVGTVMSNYGLEAALSREGIAFARSAVGDRNVSLLMEQTGAALGGETSGHIILRPFAPTGDGILTALLLSSILSESGGPISRLATLEKIPQALRNVRVEKKVPLGQLPGISRAIARAEGTLARRGRVFLRYSGTEPLLRILVEGPEASEVASIAEELEQAARRELT